MTTLIAYAPNGLKITHEYWLRPYTSPVTFGPIIPGEPLSRYDFVAANVRYEADYGANREQDVDYERNELGEELRWVDEDGERWPASLLTFREAE